MDNILEEIWYGNIIPWEQFCRGNTAMKPLTAALCQKRDTLLESMTEKQKEMLETYDISQLDIETETEKQAFAYGFRLGARLILAVTNTQTGE